MRSGKILSVVEAVVAASLFVLISYGIYIKLSAGKDAFVYYAREDGPVEYLTTIFLFLCSMVCLFRAFSVSKPGSRIKILPWALLAFLFFFAAGDEISWGQRIFGIESGDFFLQNNKQQETNLHNLVVGDTSLNKLIFSRLLFVVLIIYFLFSRLLVSRVGFFSRLQERLQVPLPRNHQIIIMIAVSLMIVFIQLPRDSELNELSFAMVFFMIFLNPYKGTL